MLMNEVVHDHLLLFSHRYRTLVTKAFTQGRRRRRPTQIAKPIRQQIAQNQRYAFQSLRDELRVCL